MMETVGLLVILAVVDCSSLSSIQREKIQENEEFANVGGATARLAQQPKSWQRMVIASLIARRSVVQNTNLHYVMLQEAKEAIQCEAKDAQ
jgi:hypothetical protein